MEVYVNGVVRALTVEEEAQKLAEVAAEVVLLQAEKAAQTKEAIDRWAGVQREAFVSSGAFIADEYTLAEAEANEYVQAGYAGTVPGCVVSWAAASGKTNAEAADDILAQAVALKSELRRVREIRLRLKSEVDALNPSTASDADFEAKISAARTELFV